MKIYGSEKVNAKSITSSYRSFEPVGGLDKPQAWRDAYFHLLEWKNTWCMPYKMDLYANKDNIPYVRILMPDKNQHTIEMLTEMMQDYGYRDVRVVDVQVCTFTPKWEEGVFDYIAEF